MSLRPQLKKFAKNKGYQFKELCTDRYELKKEYEVMAVKVTLEQDKKENKVEVSPKVVPLILASAILFAGFPPLVVFVYIFYALMSYLRTNSMKKNLKNSKVFK
jgi:hypothetical protein